MAEPTHLHMRRPAFVLMAQRQRARRRAVYALAIEWALLFAMIALRLADEDAIANALTVLIAVSALVAFAFVWRAEYLRHELRRRGY